MISLGRSTALGAGLQADEHVARVLRGGEQPQLRSGAPRVGGHLRRLGDDALDGANLAIGLAEGAAGRGHVVDHEAALVSGGKEARADVSEQDARSGRAGIPPSPRPPRGRRTTAVSRSP